MAARLKSLDPHVLDYALAAVLTVFLQFELLVTDPDSLQGSAWVNHGFGLVATASLAFRRSHPSAVLLVLVGTLMSASIFLDADLVENPFIPFFCAFLGFYSLGVNERDERRARTVPLIATAMIWAEITVSGLEDGPGEYVFVALVVVAAPFFAGRMVRSRADRADALEQLTLQLEREQEQRAELAVTEERSRIAREMHDVVAHSMSVMVIQAGAARKMMDKDPARAQEALRSIEDTGRRGLAEMRRLLGVLRTEDEGASLAPQPGIERLPELVERAREAGLPVELHVEGEPREVSPGVDLSAYRIVQEALTNTIKHAGEARAAVHVRWGRELELEVTDDGLGAGDNGRRDSGGHGLVGMQQRVALYGGSVEAGAGTDGGYRVRATLPVEEPPA